MSAKKLLLIFSLLSTPVAAEPFSMYSAEDPEYAKVMRNYGKELFGAKYSARRCADYRLRFRKEYFYNAPPNLWPNDRYDAFMSKAMFETKDMMDRKEEKVGHAEFCKGVVHYFLDNYDPKNLPIYFE